MSDVPRVTPENFPHGIICGCSCGCSVRLTDGNIMQQRVDDGESESEPWQQDDEAPPAGGAVDLLLCLDCYIGDHDGSRT